MRACATIPLDKGTRISYLKRHHIDTRGATPVHINNAPEILSKMIKVCPEVPLCSISSLFRIHVLLLSLHRCGLVFASFGLVYVWMASKTIRGR